MHTESHSIYSEFMQDFTRREDVHQLKMCSDLQHQLDEGDSSVSSVQSINLSNMTNLSEDGDSKGSNACFQKWLRAAEFYM